MRIFLLLLLLPAVALPQTTTLLLKDGNILSGKLLQSTDARLIALLSGGDTLKIKRAAIDRVALSDDRIIAFDTFTGKPVIVETEKKPDRKKYLSWSEHAPKGIYLAYAPIMPENLLGVQAHFLFGGHGVYVSYSESPDYAKSNDFYDLIYTGSSSNTHDLNLTSGYSVGIIGGVYQNVKAYFGINFINKQRFVRVKIRDDQAIFKVDRAPKNVHGFSAGIHSYVNEYFYVNTGFSSQPMGFQIGFGFRLLPFHTKL